jgi:hypothetical protein
MYVLLIVVFPFVLFLLAIVVSVLLRYTDSDWPFGIFKLFLHNNTLWPPVFFSLFFLVFLYYWVRVAPSLDEEVCRFSFVLLFAIILSVLRWSPLISPNFLPVFWFQTLLYDLNDCYLHNVSSISPIFITMYLLMHNCTPKGLKLYCTA